MLRTSKSTWRVYKYSLYYPYTFTTGLKVFKIKKLGRNYNTTWLIVNTTCICFKKKIVYSNLQQEKMPYLNINRMSTVIPYLRHWYLFYILPYLKSTLKSGITKLYNRPKDIKSIIILKRFANQWIFPSN